MPTNNHQHDTERTLLILFILGLLFLTAALATGATIMIAGLVICVAALCLVGVASLLTPRPRPVQKPGQQVMQGQQRERVR